MTPAEMVRGGRYNWQNQVERLVYKGKKGVWHQFEKVGEPGIWCEVLDEDLKYIEETKPICAGTNCYSTDGFNHSAECQAEHQLAIDRSIEDE